MKTKDFFSSLGLGCIGILLFPLSLLYDAFLDRKVARYVAYLEKKNYTMNKDKEIILCKKCLEYVQHKLMMATTTPNYLLEQECLFYERLSSLEGTV